MASIHGSIYVTEAAAWLNTTSRVGYCLDPKNNATICILCRSERYSPMNEPRRMIWTNAFRHNELLSRVSYSNHVISSANQLTEVNSLSVLVGICATRQQGTRAPKPIFTILRPQSPLDRAKFARSYTRGCESIVGCRGYVSFYSCNAV